MRPRVVVACDLPPPGHHLLAAATDLDLVASTALTTADLHALLAADPGPIHGILLALPHTLPPALLATLAPHLRVVSSISVGLDHLDLAALHRQGVRVGHTPGVLTDACAELALLLVLMARRRAMEGLAAVRNLTWPAAWSPTWMLGTQLAHAVVAVVGLGRIGRRTLQLLAPHHIHPCVLYHNRWPLSADALLDIPNALSLEFVPVLHDMLARADIVLVTCALTPQTRHLFNRDAFRAIKPSAVLVNVARGPIVDQDALYHALVQGELAAAALDVTDPEPLSADSPLRHLDNCTILPHMGSATLETRGNMARLAVANLVAGVRGEPMPAEALAPP